MVEPMPAPTDAPAPLLDPVTGQPVGPTATYTFAEWAALDADLKAADEALFTTAYPAPATTTPPTPPPGSAFVTYYGPGATQKMDRATLELKVEAMKAHFEALPPPAPPPAPPTS